jgi:hypothetical protein
VIRAHRRKVWQYKMVHFNALPNRIDVEPLLNAHGQEGWELVDFQPMVWLFKRKTVA